MSSVDSAQNHFARAQALVRSSDFHGAVGEFEAAFRRDPAGKLDRRECFHLFNKLQFEVFPDWWKEELVRFLERDDIDKDQYLPAALSALGSVKAFRSLLEAAAASELPASQIDPAAFDEIAADPLFGILLRDTLIGNSRFEHLLTAVRRELVLDSALRARAPLSFLCDVALQCFNNEFAYIEQPAERAAAEALGREEALSAIATAAMYGAPHRFTEAGLAGASLPTPFARLIKRTVVETSEHARVALSIPSLGVPAADEVSAQVRAMYEQNPYPRWLTIDRLPGLAAADWISAELIGSRRPIALPAAPRILVAGCGTGRETIRLAREITGSHVVAIDLSVASIAYAKRKAAAYGASNVEFHQADILQIPASLGKFDIVYSVGVLHHMRDTEKGLRALVRFLKPGGLFKVGLYAAPARKALRAARDYIRSAGLGTDAASIRRFRAHVLAQAPDSPLRRVMRWRDFFSMSECRDLVFHVQEEEFELDRIAQMLGGAGLAPLGVAGPLPGAAVAAYRRMFPADTLMATLPNWQAVESSVPETFEGMYRIWSVMHPPAP